MKQLLQKISPALMAYGPWGIFLLGVVDSTGLPLGPAMDVVLVGIAAASAAKPYRAYLAATMALLGSLVGNIILFMAARHGSKWFVKTEPPPGKRRKFREWFSRWGLLTVFFPAAMPVVPLPLKVFVVSAGALRTPVGRFAGVSVLARAIRYFGEAYLGLSLGEEGAKVFLARHGWAVAISTLLICLASWVIMRLVQRRGATAA
jgi:membrane protein YqaA with SNARE-associated domain